MSCALAKSNNPITAPKKPPSGPKNARPLTSGPTNHDIAGYMPGRLEFETEYENEAEASVKDMVFDGNGDPHETGTPRTLTQL